MRTLLLVVGLFGTVALLLAGCGGSGSSIARVKLLVGDAPLHLQDGTVVSGVTVHITRVELLNEAENAASRVILYEATGQPSPLDLLNLANKSLTELPSLGTVDVPAGHYSQLRVILGAENFVALQGTPDQHPLSVSSGQQTGFKIPVDVDLGDGAFETLLLDFNLARLHQQGNDFLLTPNALRLALLSQTGAVAGTLTLPEGFVLAHNLTATFTLVDATGTPVTDASQNTIQTQVTLTAGQMPPPTSATFTLNGIHTGTYTVKIEATYGDAAVPAFTVPVTITSGTTTALTVPMQGL